nr:LSM domain-containing protein [Candidatus Sigynarchaeota archaeon]
MSEASIAGRPITKIDKALGKRILIKLKGKRAIKAVLKSFDDHLNLFLEESVEIIHHWDKERKAVVKEENELDSIILRGDNVVFLTLDEAPKEEPSAATSPPAPAA